jgi:sulfite reductase (NADPH) hemoprotein beta-component
VGHLGILGIDKQGEEFYQLSLGGSPGHDASIGQIVGKAFARDQIVPAVETVLKHYLSIRQSPEDRLIDVVRRVGLAPFKEALFGPPTIRPSAEPAKGAAHADH